MRQAKFAWNSTGLGGMNLASWGARGRYGAAQNDDLWAFRLPEPDDALSRPCRRQRTSQLCPASLDADKTPSSDRFVIALVGLAFEARIASGPASSSSAAIRNARSPLARPCPQTWLPQHHQFWGGGRTGSAFAPGKLGRCVLDRRRATESSDRSGLVGKNPGDDPGRRTQADRRRRLRGRRPRSQTANARRDRRGDRRHGVASRRPARFDPRPEFHSGQGGHRSCAPRRAGCRTGRHAPRRRHERHGRHARADRRDRRNYPACSALPMTPTRRAAPCSASAGCLGPDFGRLGLSEA